MWEDIIFAFAPSVLEAIGTKLIDIKDKLSIQNKLTEIINEQFECFADSSLDNSEFYSLIKSTRFIELIRNFFFQKE